MRVLRFAFAATVAMLIAQIFNWPLSFVAPVLVVALLEIPIPAPLPRDFLANLGYSLASVAAVFVFVMLLEPYPLVFIVAYGLAIFLSVYFLNKGAPLLAMLLVLIAAWALPILGNIHEGATAYIAVCLSFSAVIAVVVLQIAYGILPDPPGSERVEMPRLQSGYSARAAQAATLATIATAPAMTAFLVFDWSSELVVMIYIGVISMEGSLAHSLYDLKKYLTANAIGALGALVFYVVLVAVPEVHFLALLTLLATLLFGARRFSDAPDAKYFGSALIGLIILISSSVGPGQDIDLNILKRILFIFVGGMYVVGVMSIAEPWVARLFPESDSGHS